MALDDDKGPKISLREALIADNHAAMTGKCTHCGDEHTTAQHKAHGPGSFRRQHPGLFKRWNVTHTIAGGRAEDVSQVSGANEDAARVIAEKVLPKGSKILKIKYAGTIDGLPIPEAPKMASHYARVEIGTRRIVEGKGKGKILGPKTSAKKPKAAKKASKAAAAPKKPSTAKKVAAKKTAAPKKTSPKKMMASVGKVAPKLTPAVEKRIREEAKLEERARCNKAKRAKKASNPKAPKASKKKAAPAKVQAIAKAVVEAEKKVIVKEVAKAVQEATSGRRGDMSDKAGGESGGLMGSGAVTGARRPGPKPKADRDAAKAARGERSRFSPADIKGLAAELAAATKRPAKKAPAARKAADPAQRKGESDADYFGRIADGESAKKKAPKPKPNGKGKAKAKKVAKKKAGKK